MLNINFGQLIKETILLLVALQVVWLLLPRWTKRIIKGVTRLVYKSGKNTTLYAKKHYKNYYKQHKKATHTKAVEQPSNVIKIIYPDGTIREYPKAK